MNNIIRNEFPYPIAKVYLKATNAEEPIEKFTMIGYLFEITLKFAAAISISEYLNSTTKDKTINNILSGITKPSLGKWAEFLRETLKFNIRQNQSTLSENYFKKSSNLKNIITGVNRINEQLNPEKQSIISTVSPELFVNTFIQFRNKTKGHGAIQKLDCQKINDVLLEATEEFILSFEEYRKYFPAFISKIELDKHKRYNLTLLRLSGTDIIRSSYLTQDLNSAFGVGRICICEAVEEGLKPIINLHPLIIFLEEREEVYVLNESESSKMEYLCYHIGGKDAIYSPDELKEDFTNRFGEILNQVKTKLKTKAVAETSEIFHSGTVESTKKLPLKMAVGFSAFFIILLFCVYFILIKKTEENKPVQNLMQNSDTNINRKNATSSIDSNKNNSTDIKKIEITKNNPDLKNKSELEVNKKPASTLEPEYITDPDIPAISSDRAENFLDYSNLKMSPDFKGNVKIKAYINETGKVDRTETIGGGIDSRFNSAAETAVKKMIFSPSLKAGKKVKSILTVIVSFQGKK
jgi:hypothetical protein